MKSNLNQKMRFKSKKSDFLILIKKSRFISTLLQSLLPTARRLSSSVFWIVCQSIDKNNGKTHKSMARKHTEEVSSSPCYIISVKVCGNVTTMTSTNTLCKQDYVSIAFMHQKFQQQLLRYYCK